MESAALDTGQWLKDNAFHCIRLEANISKSACGEQPLSLVKINKVLSSMPAAFTTDRS